MGGGEAAAAAVGKGVSAVCVAWPAKINQIIVGLSSGDVKMYYDPAMSTKGALLCAKRKARKANELDLLLASRADQASGSAEIFTPHALPLFKDKEKKTKRARERERMDPVKAKIPEKESGGVMGGGALSNNKTFHQNAVDELGMTSSEARLQSRDPRADLFKYNTINPTGLKTGLEKQQPTILASTTAEQEQEKRKRQKTSSS